MAYEGFVCHTAQFGTELQTTLPYLTIRTADDSAPRLAFACRGIVNPTAGRATALAKTADDSAQHNTKQDEVALGRTADDPLMTRLEMAVPESA